MNQELKDRAIKIAKHILKTGDTVRKTAQIFGISKSAVHNDISKNLKKINLILYLRTRHILSKNFKQKHIKGGQSTKQKFAKIKANF